MSSKCAQSRSLDLNLISMGEKENVLCLKEGGFCPPINFNDKDQILLGVVTDL
jgi:hypothetical protein